MTDSARTIATTSGPQATPTATIASRKDDSRTMKAVEWHGKKDIRVGERPRPMVTDSVRDYCATTTCLLHSGRAADVACCCWADHRLRLHAGLDYSIVIAQLDRNKFTGVNACGRCIVCVRAGMLNGLLFTLDFFYH